MITAAELAGLRADHEEMMRDRGTIHTPDGPPAWNPDTQRTEPRPGQLLYTGRIRVQASQSRTGEQTAGQQQITTGLFVCAVPWTVTDLMPGCVVRVTDSHDPRLVGRRLQITDVQASTFATARRFFAIDHENND